MEENSGFQVIKRRGRNHWAPICENWVQLIDEYARVHDYEDASYWYNEMTDVSVLAGAAWRSGLVALTEAQVEKGARHRPKRYGRCDLYIASEAYDEHIEAKHRKVTMRTGDLIGALEEGLETALNDAHDTAGRDRWQSTGVCFYALKMPESQADNRQGIDTLVSECIRAAKSLRADVTAWAFPIQTRRLSDGYGTLWPGTIMLARGKH